MSKKRIFFTKMQGLGNDFILIDVKAKMSGRAGLKSYTEKFSKFSKRYLDRRFGIGGDGVIFVLESKVADVRMRIFNPDGSEAEMCGNGIRCLAVFLKEKGMVKKNEIRIETSAGIKTVKIKGNLVTVNMGSPSFDPDDIPVLIDSHNVFNYPIEVKNKFLKANFVSMGNPHTVLFTDEPVDLKEVGPIIENNKIFPQRTNVEFVKVKKKH